MSHLLFLVMAPFGSVVHMVCFVSCRQVRCEKCLCAIILLASFVTILAHFHHLLDIGYACQGTYEQHYRSPFAGGPAMTLAVVLVSSCSSKCILIVYYLLRKEEIEALHSLFYRLDGSMLHLTSLQIGEHRRWG